MLSPVLRRRSLLLGCLLGWLVGCLPLEPAKAPLDSTVEIEVAGNATYGAIIDDIGVVASKEPEHQSVLMWRSAALGSLKDDTTPEPLALYDSLPPESPYRSAFDAVKAGTANHMMPEGLSPEEIKTEQVTTVLELQPEFKLGGKCYILLGVSQRHNLLSMAVLNADLRPAIIVHDDAQGSFGVFGPGQRFRVLKDRVKAVKAVKAANGQVTFVDQGQKPLP